MLYVEPMFPEVDTSDPAAVESEVQAAYLAMFPSAHPDFVPTVFEWAVECFSGQYDDYQAIDARYHDFEHTLQGALCLTRLLRGYHQSGATPRINDRLFRLTIIAILMHDTGYLKKRDDTEGTGAKYTLTHVNRSAEFAGRLLLEQGFSPEDIKTVQNMIRCTGVNVDLSAIPFQSEAERITGFALGSADLLGQMAASDYVDKLPVLYLEFAESASHNAGKMTTGGNFISAKDLMEKTPLFWERYVLPKLSRDFLGLFKYLGGDAEGNDYIRRIQANIQRLREMLQVGALC